MLTFILIAISGLFAGMTINYLSDILPVRRKLARPVCLHCGHLQHSRNYFIFPRRCPSCGTRRSWRTAAVEIFTVGFTLLLWYFPENHMIPDFWVNYALMIFFGVVVVVDIELRLILHPVSAAGAVLGLAIGVSLHGWQTALAGGVLGYLVMFSLYYLGGLFSKLLARVQGKEIDEVALGFGDVNLTGVLGLILGLENILLGLILSIVLAAIFSVAYILFHLVRGQYRLGLAIPYGPFLVFGAVLVLYLPVAAQRMLVLFFPLFSVGQ